VSEKPVNDIVEAESSEEAIAKINETIAEIIAWTLGCQLITFLEFERQLIPKIFVLGKLFILLFLSMREEQYKKIQKNVEANYKNQGPKPRLFACFFGKLRYWRSYLFNLSNKGGYYPLDIELGLTQDSFSMLVQSYAIRLATFVTLR